MEQTEKKLQTFRETVLKDAQQKKEEMLNEVEKTRKETIAQAEHEILQRAYSTIQREKTAVIREKNERVSKALAESKKVLLMERESILHRVFQALYERIDQYRKTEEYKQDLLRSVREGIQSVGEGECCVHIDSRDQSLLPFIKLSVGCEVVIDHIDLLGGCRVANKTKHIICDNSLTERISEIKCSFLEETGLFI